MRFSNQRWGATVNITVNITGRVCDRQHYAIPAVDICSICNCKGNLLCRLRLGWLEQVDVCMRNRDTCIRMLVFNYDYVVLIQPAQSEPAQQIPLYKASMRLAEHGWKPHRMFVARKSRLDLSQASIYSFMRQTQRGEGSSNFISGSTSSTVFCQPLKHAGACGPSASYEYLGQCICMYVYIYIYIYIYMYVCTHVYTYIYTYFWEIP